MTLGISKEQQLAYHIKRKAAKTPKAQGNAAENEVIEKVTGKKPDRKNRRGNQTKPWAGYREPDIKLEDWSGFHWEVKDCKTLQMPAWIIQVCNDAGPDIPVIAFKQPDKDRFWIAFPMEALEDFCCTGAQAKGHELI